MPCAKGSQLKHSTRFATNVDRIGRSYSARKCVRCDLLSQSWLRMSAGIFATAERTLTQADAILCDARKRAARVRAAPSRGGWHEAGKKPNPPPRKHGGGRMISGDAMMHAQRPEARSMSIT